MDRAYKIDGAVGIYTENPWDFSVNTEHPSGGNMQKIYVPYHVFQNYKFGSVKNTPVNFCINI